MDIELINESMRESFEHEVTHPVTGEGGWFVELATKANASAQAKVAAILDRIKKRKATTQAQEDQDINALLCAHILGWKGLTGADGEVPYTPETAMKIISGPKSFWIREQLLAAIGDPTKPFLS